MVCTDAVIQLGREFHSGRRRIKDRVSVQSYDLLLCSACIAVPQFWYVLLGRIALLRT